MTQTPWNTTEPAAAPATPPGAAAIPWAGGGGVVTAEPPAPPSFASQPAPAPVAMPEPEPVAKPTFPQLTGSDGQPVQNFSTLAEELRHPQLGTEKKGYEKARVDSLLTRAADALHAAAQMPAPAPAVDHSDELANLRAQLAEAQRAANQANAEKATLQGQVEAREATINQLKVDFDRANSASEGAGRQRDADNARHAETIQQLEAARSEIAALQASRDQALGRASASDEHSRAVAEQLGAANAELEIARLRLHELEALEAPEAQATRVLAMAEQTSAATVAAAEAEAAELVASARRESEDIIGDARETIDMLEKRGAAIRDDLANVIRRLRASADSVEDISAAFTQVGAIDLDQPAALAARASTPASASASKPAAVVEERVVVPAEVDDDDFNAVPPGQTTGSVVD